MTLIQNIFSHGPNENFAYIKIPPPFAQQEQTVSQMQFGYDLVLTKIFVDKIILELRKLNGE